MGKDNMSMGSVQWWQGRWLTVNRHPVLRPVCCDNEKHRADMRTLLSWAACGTAQFPGMKLWASMKLDLGLDYTGNASKMQKPRHITHLATPRDETVGRGRPLGGDLNTDHEHILEKRSPLPSPKP